MDNLELILPLLKFESKDDFYYIQILQRKKENPQIGSNSKVVKNYYINSEQYLLDKWEEIKKLCDVFNARAMIRLNKRSFEKVAFKAMVNIANTISNREYQFLKASYDRACGLGHNDKNKSWVLDIDEHKDFDWYCNLVDFIHNIKPVGDKVIGTIPSKSGKHIIAKPFDLRQFSIQYPDIDVHKDNTTNLYIPE
jgi:hypothetical protein